MPIPILINAPNLRAELARNRVPMSRLARAAGVSEVYLRDVLAGRTPGGELLARKLAEGLASLNLAEVAELCISVPTGKVVAGE